MSARLQAAAAPEAPDPMISTSTMSFIPYYPNSRLTFIASLERKGNGRFHHPPTWFYIIGGGDSP